MQADPITRFWPKTTPQGACLLWTGSRKRGRLGEPSYGFFNDGTKQVQAHRFIYERCIEPLNGRILMHTCDTPGCVALQHLTPGTQAQNVADCVAKDRQYRPPLATHCAHGHPFDERNTYVDPKGRRTCRICRETQRATYRSKGNGRR